MELNIVNVLKSTVFNIFSTGTYRALEFSGNKKKKF